jgi:hypothetical protein
MQPDHSPRNVAHNAFAEMPRSQEARGTARSGGRAATASGTRRHPHHRLHNRALRRSASASSIYLARSPRTPRRGYECASSDPKRANFAPQLVECTRGPIRLVCRCIPALPSRSMRSKMLTMKLSLRSIRGVHPALPGVLLLILSFGFARADALAADPLPTDPLLTDPLLVEAPVHGFCWRCSDNGTDTPVSRDPPFGFSMSSGPSAGFYVDFLVPIYAVSTSSALTYVNGEQGGTANNQSINATAKLVSTTPWTSGDFVDYLKFATLPRNPIDALLPSPPGASGYFVYDAALDGNTLADPRNGTAGLQSQLGSGGSPRWALRSLIFGFLKTALLLLGGGLFVLGAARWVRRGFPMMTFHTRGRRWPASAE